MGRSASRRSSTRSGVVRLLALFFGMFFLPQAAPIPPLAFFRGEQRVARLCYRGLKCVQTADVDALAREAAKFLVHFARILPRELTDRANAQHFKVAQHGGADGNQILQPALRSVGHKNLLDKDNASSLSSTSLNQTSWVRQGENTKCAHI